MLDTEQIKKILPHRGRQLLVDQIVEIERPNRCVGTKVITEEDAIAPGEGGLKVFPRSLVIEAMAQVGGIPMHQDDGVPAYLVAVDGFVFHDSVHAGETLRMEGQIEWMRGKLFKAVVTASTDRGVVAEGHVLYAAESAMHFDIAIAPHAHVNGQSQNGHVGRTNVAETEVVRE
jgi:3-hydroxyacyl-[acyl-carrier-protein] dehydratase